jgi:hypothetical protein
MVDNDLDGGDLQNWNGEEAYWDKVVTNKNAPVTNVSISATGGDDVSSFYASLGYNKTEATTIMSDFKRISGSLNYTRKLADKVRFGINSNVSNTFQNAYLEQSAYFANPNLTKYFMSPWYNPYLADGSPNFNLGGLFHPVYLAENDINTNDFTRALVNSYLEWDIIKDLKFRTFVSMDYNLVNYKQYQNRIHGDSAAENGSAYASADRNYNTVFQNSLDYTLRFNDHNIGFKALMEFQKNKHWGLWVQVKTSPLMDLQTFQVLVRTSTLHQILTTGVTSPTSEW